MATSSDVLAYLSGRYRKQIAREDKMKEVVAPIGIGDEAPVLAGLLGARFQSRITGSFIARSGRTAGEVCDETVLRTRRSREEERIARLSAFVDGRLSRLSAEMPDEDLAEEENAWPADILDSIRRS